MLKLSVDAENLHVDATYKLNVQGYPVICIGTTDKAQRFHLIGLALTKREARQDFAFVFNAVQEGMMLIINRTIQPKFLICDACCDS